MITFEERRRAELEAAAERAADAVMRGRDDLAAPLAIVIEALDAIEHDPDFEDGGDFEEQHDAERGCWGSGATMDQLRLTYAIGPDGRLLSRRRPPDVPGLARVTNALPWREVERIKARLKALQWGLA